MEGGREYNKTSEHSNPTTSHKTPQSSQVFRSPANPIDKRPANYLHKGDDIVPKSWIIEFIGSAVANLLNRRLSTNLYNHVADLGYRNRPSEDIPTELAVSTVGR
jgi:hypothetical protein